MTDAVPGRTDRDFSAAIAGIRQHCEDHFTHSAQSHDWDHTLRVHSLCMHIGRAEKADLDILSMAAYLHDIGRAHQDASRGRICHAEKGAEMAAGLLTGLDLPVPMHENIIHCILTHRFRNSHVPESIEARVLFDADKLDSIGAIGIARAYLFAGEIGAVLHNPDVTPEDCESYSRNDTGYREFKVKLCRVKDRMLTAEGRRMAVERHFFMENFFDRFQREYLGEF